MHVATYQDSLRRLQPIVQPVFETLQHGLDVAAEQHSKNGWRRRVDESYFSHTVRREACEKLREYGLLRTAEDGERSINGLSGIQLYYDGIVLSILRSQDGSVPLPITSSKQEFYRQQTIDGWDNQLLLWRDVAGVLSDPMTLVRPVGGDHRRRNLRYAWVGPLSRSMAGMRAADLDMLEPTEQQDELGDESGT